MKLLIATPGASVIQDPEFGQSLISVFHEIAMKLAPDAEPPANAMIPKEWCGFSKWGLESDEEGRDYSCQLEILWPDGSTFAKQEIPASQPTRNGISFIFRFTAFPIGQPGRLSILTRLLSAGQQIHPEVEMNVKVRLEKTLDTF
jgi:hypothetical protein